MFAMSSCWMPTIPSRTRLSCALGSTLLPAGAKTPVVVLNRELLDVGVPMSSFACARPSRLASFQHGALAVVLHAPLDWFGPHVSAGCSNKAPSPLAVTSFVP